MKLIQLNYQIKALFFFKFVIFFAENRNRLKEERKIIYTNLTYMKVIFFQLPEAFLQMLRLMSNSANTKIR